MADPLSISASVAGLVTLADIVFDRLIAYGKSVKHAEVESRKLAREVVILRGLLDSLARLADALHHESFDSKFRMHHLEACDRTLSEIHETLKKHTGGNAAKNLIWPFKERHLKELHEDLSRHKETINTALSANSLEAILRLLTNEQDHAAEILQEVKNNTKITTRIRKDEERRKILEYYLKVNPQDNYDMSRRLRHSETGLWLTRLPDFQRWLTAPNSRLWLKGIPGAGKTVLAGVIIGEALNKSTESVATAFFFCDYKNEHTHSPGAILQVLIYQLAIQKEEAYAKLEQHYQAHNPAGGLSKTPDVESLSGVLQQIMKLYDHVFLVVDGIDECGKYTEDVLEILTTISEAGNNISMALLSRDEDNIRDWLEGISVPIEISAQKDDVSKYVRAQLGDRIQKRRLRFDDPDLKEEILDKLVEGSKGMFRWVACQLDQLAKCDSDQECRDALNSLPPTLDETYIRILERIPKNKARMVGLALNCIAHSRDPLTISQLRELLSVPKAGNTLKPGAIIREGAITRHCSSLLRKSTNGSVLEFSHFSVLEFLEGNLTKRSDLDEFYVSKSRAELLMAIEYLKYLQLDNVKKLFPDPQDIMDYMTSCHMGTTNETLPLYPVAALDWTIYASSHWGEPEIISLAKSLFSPNKTTIFLAWVISFARRTSSKEFDPILIDVMTHPTFTPLHMAAALSLPEICRHLLCLDLNPSIRSPIGNPIQCAVQGLWSFHSYERPHICDEGSDLSATLDTLMCLQQAGATLQFRCCSPFEGYSLSRLALKTARVDGTLLLPSSLLLAGAELEERDVDVAENNFGLTINLPSLRTFVETLSKLVDKSPTHLRLYSLAWKKATTKYNLDSIFDATASNNPLDVSDQAFTAVQMGNLQFLQRLLHHPQVEAAELKDKDGNSLLHWAMKPAQRNSSVEIIQLLLEVGCGIKMTNNAGDQPLHVWASIEADKLAVGHKTVQLLTERGSDCAHQNSNGMNVLHLAVKYPLQLQIILRCQTTGSITWAMESTNTEGYTPFSWSLQTRNLKSAVIMMENIKFNSAMIQSPKWILALAAHASSEQIFNFLISSDLDIPSHDEVGRGPLHFLDYDASEAFVSRLKSLYPTACELHAVGGPPMQVYLTDIVQNGFPYASSVSSTIMRHLYVKDTPTFSMWETFVSKLLPKIGDRLRRDFIATDRITLIGTAILQLGYLDSYETQTGESGLVPLLVYSRSISFFELAPLVRQVIQQTRFWAEFCKSQEAVRLLKGLLETHSPGPDGHLNFMKLLLDKGVSIHQSVDGCSVLEKCMREYACPHTSDSETVFDIIVKYVDKTRINEAGPDGLAAIHLVPARCTWMLELLIQRGADANLCVSTGDRCPAIVHHLIYDHHDNASALLKHGADPCKASTGGWNATIAASFSDATQCLEEMYCADQLQKRIDWGQTCKTMFRGKVKHSGVNGIQLAAYFGHVATLNFYTERGLSRYLKSKSGNGFTPLHYATLSGSLKAVEFLIGKGCDLDSQGVYGSTPLHLAARQGNYEIAQRLVKAECHLSLDTEGYSPIFYAHRRNNMELVEYLQSNFPDSTGVAQRTSETVGIAFTLQNRTRSKALEEAISHDNLTLCQYLHNNGCNLEALLPGCGGCTPLVKALIFQRLDIIEWFLDQHVSMSRADCYHIQRPNLSSLNLLVENSVMNGLLPKAVNNYMLQGGTFIGDFLIHAAVGSGNLQGLQILLDHLRVNEEHYAPPETPSSKSLCI